LTFAVTLDINKTLGNCTTGDDMKTQSSPALNQPKQLLPKQPLMARADESLTRYVPAYRASELTARVSIREHLRLMER
jgi:hypothetical protein